ncbi:hypothetical protein B0T20DRAFT_353944 [Sordaria brevicollis]|uniref:Extracellular serine-rich protein n=1 Tax=Sordaria brevicollis TaxID=83679 RepID=A0AAE0PG22_SORBR|nr:hypothetical protein B0T20DRAFT_353944 [Sordaria brevicollis]
MLPSHAPLATWVHSMLAISGMVAAETIVIKADGLVFGPELITANKGDILEFHFLPSNHSVVKGSFGHPCQPATEDVEGRFFSGFLPAKEKEENPSIFKVTITSTSPFPFYCSYPSHCANGMVGIVNGSPDQLAQYKVQAAKEAARQPNGDFPFEKMNPSDPSKAFGGEIAKNPDYAAWYGPTGTDAGAAGATEGAGGAGGAGGADGYGQAPPAPPPPPESAMPPPPPATGATTTTTTTGTETTTGAVGGVGVSGSATGTPVGGTVVTSTSTGTETLTMSGGEPTSATSTTSDMPPEANGVAAQVQMTLGGWSGMMMGLFGHMCGVVMVVGMLV